MQVQVDPWFHAPHAAWLSLANSTKREAASWEHRDWARRAQGSLGASQTHGLMGTFHLEARASVQRETLQRVDLGRRVLLLWNCCWLRFQGLHLPPHLLMGHRVVELTCLPQKARLDHWNWMIPALTPAYAAPAKEEEAVVHLQAEAMLGAGGSPSSQQPGLRRARLRGADGRGGGDEARKGGIVQLSDAAPGGCIPGRHAHAAVVIQPPRRWG